MAEGPEQRSRQEEINRERLSSDRGEVGSDVSQAASQDEVESLRLELARTRAEMSGSVYELQGRMSSDYLKQQAKESSSGLVKRNTAPLALMGAGIGWMVYNSVSGGGSSSSSGSSGGQGGRQQNALESRQESYDYPYGSSSTSYGDYENYGDYEDQGQSQRGSTDQAREKASEVKGQLSGQAGQAQEQAQQKAQQAQREAQQRAQQAKGGFQNLLQDNPLAVGAIAIGIGTAIGLSIPETEKENQAMGQTRDQLANQAQRQADDAARRTQSVAEQARNTAEQEARRQGAGE